VAAVPGNNRYLGTWSDTYGLSTAPPVIKKIDGDELSAQYLGCFNLEKEFRYQLHTGLGGPPKK
jgi:hypothetical protein